MEGLNEIHWHDSEIESVIEMRAKDELVYNVQYPEDWSQNVFTAMAITFCGYHSHVVEEMPSEGNPTILAVSVVEEEGGYTTAKLETNAGNRFVTAKSVHIGPRHVSI
ncbi:hypothetical protein [Alcanivorax sp.]|uniref:hypothetical protein n=1 Tax=Alcanivorax sp. TaxID=1872427 RepID=UPI002B264F07|nr:hypothetical protein [Alcanivorax sp.]